MYLTSFLSFFENKNIPKAQKTIHKIITKHILGSMLLISGTHPIDQSKHNQSGQSNSHKFKK